MNLNIRLGTAGYNEIVVSNGMFSLGRNDTVNASVPESHRTPVVHAHMPKAAYTSASEVHKKERVALILTLEYGMLFVNETRRGDPSQMPSISLSEAHDKGQSPSNGRLWTTLGKCLNASS